MTRLFFRKSQRIVSDDDFRRVLSRKCFVCKGMLRLYAAENGLGIPRFGISVSKSCGNAVVRNRLKRFGREVFRRHQHEIPAGFDYILIFTQKKPKTKAKAVNTAAKKGTLYQYGDFESLLLTMMRSLERKMA